MKKIILSLFLFLFFLSAWFGRYKSVELSALHPDVIEIEIKGEVHNPGTYILPWQSNLEDAIDAAGGLKETASIDELSLLKELRNNDVVVIAKKQDEGTLKISLNTATLEELQQLPGIGPSLAGKIIEYRKDQSFTSIEQIMEVKGIKEKMFEKIREYLCL